MRLDNLLENIECDVLHCKDSCEVTGVVCDSRKVRPGNVFVALKGTKQDGVSFITNAFEQGAAAVVSSVDTVISGKVCQIKVEDPRREAGILADAFHNNPSSSLEVIGITGTNGKTTTTYMARDILRHAGRNPGLIGTIEYQIGGRVIPAARTTPESPDIHSMLAQMAGGGCQSAVMEVSSHGIVQQRVAGVDFDVVVFTNLSRDHLDYHETMEKYFEAKTGLFLDIKGDKDTVPVVNGDDQWGKRLAEMLKDNERLLTFGLDEGNDVRATDVELSAGLSKFKISTPWGNAEVSMKILGRYNIYNALAAIASCGSLGVSLDVMVESLSNLTAVPGRLEEIPSSKGFKVFVDYAHTDDALEKVLTTLREITENCLISVFGCGGNRDRSKRPAMAEVSGRLADLTVVTSDNPRKEDPEFIIDEICVGFPSRSEYEIIMDRREAIDIALKVARPGDIVLIAGKGHEGFQELVNTTIPFDDRRVVRECLGEE